MHVDILGRMTISASADGVHPVYGTPTMPCGKTRQGMPMLQMDSGRTGSANDLTHPESSYVITSVAQTEVFGFPHMHRDSMQRPHHEGGRSRTRCP